MTYLQAIKICSELNTDKEVPDDLVIGEAVQKILSMATINAVTKDVLLNIVRYCFPMIWRNVILLRRRRMTEDKYCSRFYCTLRGDLYCCAACIYREHCCGKCLNDPSRCGLEDAARAAEEKEEKNHGNH